MDWLYAILGVVTLLAGAWVLGVFSRILWSIFKAGWDSLGD